MTMPIARTAVVLAMGVTYSAGTQDAPPAEPPPVESPPADPMPAWPTADSDGFTFEDAAERFREHMQAVLGLPGHDAELAPYTLEQAVDAFGVSQGIELPEGWRFTVASQKPLVEDFGTRLHGGYGIDLAPSRTVPREGRAQWRALIDDGRVVDFASDTNTGERPKVYPDGERTVVLEVGFDDDPFPIKVYADDRMDGVVWSGTIRTDQGEAFGATTGFFRSDAALVIANGRHYVFARYTTGFCFHAFDRADGSYLGGYAYNGPYVWTDEEGNEGLDYRGSDPAGRVYAAEARKEPR